MRKPAIQSKSTPAGAPAPETARPRIPVWLLTSLLVLVTIAVYWPAMRCDFINFDDPAYVTVNPHVQAGLNWEGVKWAFCNTEQAAYWAPLTWLSHMLDCQLFGLNPWGHHLTNVLLHSLNAALVFVLLQRLTGVIWRSLLVAVLFAFHPLHVESVAWVSERKDVLSTFFVLLTLIFYTRYAQRRSSVEGRALRVKESAPSADQKQPSTLDLRPSTNLALDLRHSTLDYCAALLFFALGLMSKPMLVTWPFVMLLLDYWPLQRSSELKDSPRPSILKPQLSTLLWEKIPFFALAVVASCVTFVVQKQGGAVMSLESLPLGARVGNALVSYCRYLGKLVWPTDLAVFYPHPGHWPLAWILSAGLLLVVISVLFFAERRRYPFLLMGWLWFCGTLVPVIQLVQSGGQAMADRFAYIPSLGVLILAIWGVEEVTRHWRHRVIALSVAGSMAIVLCLVLTRQQLGYWQDSETLFRYALAVTKNNYLAHNNLGDALERKGQTNEAVSQYREAIRLKPAYVDSHYNLGNLLLKQGQTDEAISQFQEVIRLKPADVSADVDTFYNLGSAFYKKGQMDEASKQLQEVIHLKPDYAEAHYSLGMIFSLKGLMDEAIKQFQEVIRLKPDYAEAHNWLAVAFDRESRTDEAINQYQEYIRLKPDDADAHYNLGNAFVRKGLMDEAIKQFQEVIRLKPDYVEAYDNLGMALVASGRLDEAVQNYRQAIQADPKRPETFYFLGLTLSQLGRTREVVDSYQAALKLNPDLAAALNNLAWILATSPDDQIRNGAEAVPLAERACELTHYAQPQFVGTLAAAYAEAGRFPEAVTTAEKAEQVATHAGLTAVAAENRQLLDLYRAGKPYHESAPAGQN
jgi:protein O-mannosyl-transferase